MSGARPFRSCPVCRGAGRVEIKCASCRGTGSVDDWRFAVKITMKAWADFADGQDGAQERLVEALGMLQGMAS